MSASIGAIVLTDLDQTLIYSRNAIRSLTSGEAEPDLTCVELLNGDPTSFMTGAAARELEVLAARLPVVPVTTRSVEQTARVGLPGPPPPFIVCANGGRVLVDGIPDPTHSSRVAQVLADGGAPLREVVDEVLKPILELVPQSCHLRFREVEDLFGYAVHDAKMPDDLLAQARGGLERRGWRVVEQGRKVYFLPQSLTKVRGAAAVVEQLGAELVLAAGDSLLDLEVLELADRAICPRHGALASHPSAGRKIELTASTGLRAGEEVVQRLVEWTGPT